MEVRFEVWTRPESGTFVRKFPLPQIVTWSMQLGLFGRGSITLPRDYPRLNDILFVDPADHSNDKASMIRAFYGDTHLYDFYAVRAVINLGNNNTKTATIDGGGPGTALDRVMVRQFDYDVNPSRQPLWKYGVSNSLLDNERFEDSTATAFTNADFEDGKTAGWSSISGVDTNPLDVDMETTISEAQSGTYSLKLDPGKRHSGARTKLSIASGEELTIDGFAKGTTGRRVTAVVKVEPGMTFASVNGYIFNGWHIVELGNVARNPARNGLPGGSLTGGWDALGTIKVTPGDDTTDIIYGVQDDHHNNTNGPVFYIDTFSGTGFGIGLDPWRSYLLTAMGLDDTGHVIEGTQSAKVTGPNGAAIYQDIDDMEIGLQYTAKFVVYHEAGADRNISAQYTVPGNPGATVITAYDVVDSTDTEITVSWIATSKMGRVEVKNTSGGVLTWWVDNTAAGLGLPLSTYGKIMGDLLDDAATDHAPRDALNWLVKTFGDTDDSNSVAWNKKIGFSINQGQPYRRIVTFHGDNFRYEADIHPNPANLTEIQFDLFNKEGMGTDLTTGDGGAVTGVGLVFAGPIVRREPLASYAMVEGNDQWWGESRNTVLEAAWGNIEIYRGSDEAVVGTLTDLAQEHTTGIESETIAVKFQAPTLIPGIDYKIGDIVRLMLGEDILPAAPFRVLAIDVQSSDPKPLWSIQFVSESA